MQKIEVRSQALYATSPEATPPTVAFELLDEELCIRELITRTVEEQIRTLRAFHALEAEQTLRILARHYLTEEDIQAQAKAGMIHLPSQKLDEPPILVESALAVGQALKAFEQRTYLVIVDGKIAQSLEEKLRFRPGCKITFVRLRPLVGG